MTRSPASFETADAILIYRAVGHPEVAQTLNAEFDPDLVRGTVDNALALMNYGFDGRPLPAYGFPVDGQQTVRAQDAETTGALDIQEAELSEEERKAESLAALQLDLDVRTVGRRPSVFSVAQSEIVTTALLRLARLPDRNLGTEREVMHFLARRSPSRAMRDAYWAAFLGMVQAPEHSS